MNPHTHFLFPFFIALILNYFKIINMKFAIICGLIGMLVDIDHYVEHIIHSKTNKFSLISTWTNSIKTHRFVQRSFIHNKIGVVILTIIILIIGLFNYKISIILGIGYYSHIFLDHIWINKPHYLRIKLGKIYFKESHFEIFLDILLLMGILILAL